MDYSHNDRATQKRAEKAATLAAFSWDRDIHPTHLQRLPAKDLRALANAAGVNPPSSDETWAITRNLLAKKAEWAARNPTHPKAAHPHMQERGQWLSALTSPLQPEAAPPTAADQPKQQTPPRPSAPPQDAPESAEEPDLTNASPEEQWTGIRF